VPRDEPAGPRRLVDRPAGLPWAVLLLTVGGGVLRVILAGQDLFADELATYWVVSTRGFTGVVETVSTTAEITPPLSFVLSWLTTRIGLSPELVRLPALIAGIASIPLVYAVGTRTVGRDAALLAAALTTLSPFMIYYSAEARGYGVLMALLLLSTWALLHAVEDGGRRWWVLYSACVCLAAYTHYTSVFVLAAQLAWAFWAHPRARRALLIATAIAALLFIPWLPSLRGDIDSPTTKILSALSPLSIEAVRMTLGHWTMGFPYSGPTRSLSDLPGRIPMVMLAVSIGLGVHGLWSARPRVPAWFARHEGHGVLIVVLAVATPAGTLLQSAVDTNVFSVRSLAASWPYLAIAVAALVTVSRPALRTSAAALAVAAFAVGAGTLLTDDFVRPDFTGLARFTDDHPGAVILNGAALTPGPYTNFEVEGSMPDAEVFRLFLPEQKVSPWRYGDPLPDPTEVSQRGMAAADGGPIIFIGAIPLPPRMQEMIEQLPPGYEHTDTKVIEGIVDMQAQVFERRAAG
jgi:hypothetical protein